MSKTERVQQLLDVIAAAQEALTALRVVPDGDDYPFGAMIKMVIKRNDKEYTYLLLKIKSNYVLEGGVTDGLWYHTGQRMHNGSYMNRPIVGWNNLMKWVTRIGVVSWEQLEVMRDEPSHPLCDPAPLQVLRADGTTQEFR